MEYSPYCFDELLLKTLKLWVCFGFGENVCEHHQYFFFWTILEQSPSQYHISRDLTFSIFNWYFRVGFSIRAHKCFGWWYVVFMDFQLWITKSIKVSIASICFKSQLCWTLLTQIQGFQGCQKIRRMLWVSSCGLQKI